MVTWVFANDIIFTFQACERQRRHPRSCGYYCTHCKIFLHTCLCHWCMASFGVLPSIRNLVVNGDKKKRGISHQVKSSQYEVWLKVIIENEQNINPNIFVQHLGPIWWSSAYYQTWSCWSIRYNSKRKLFSAEDLLEVLDIENILKIVPEIAHVKWHPTLHASKNSKIASISNKFMDTLIGNQAPKNTTVNNARSCLNLL